MAAGGFGGACAAGAAGFGGAAFGASAGGFGASPAPPPWGGGVASEPPDFCSSAISSPGEEPYIYHLRATGVKLHQGPQRTAWSIWRNGANSGRDDWHDCDSI